MTFLAALTWWYEALAVGRDYRHIDARRWQMGRNAGWLSAKQIDVLDWIQDGCPSSGAEVDVGRRIVARSLHWFQLTVGNLRAASELAG